MFKQEAKLIHAGKTSFFEVLKDDKPHSEVSVNIRCTCDHSTYDNARSQYGVVCWAVKLVMDKYSLGILNDESSPGKFTLEKRNQALSLLEPMNRKTGIIRLGAESKEHIDLKIKICEHLQRRGFEFVTEAKFVTGGRCDIFCLDTFTAYEIAVSEKSESIERKKLTYPVGIKVVEIRGTEL